MKKTIPPLWVLLLLMPFASVSGVLFTPALPEIAKLLGVGEDTAQGMMTVYLFGYALGNLPYGPIAKRFGRKPAIYIGVAIAILGALTTILGGQSGKFSLFLFGRFLTALGACVGMKISFTMIADTYEKAEATQKMALTTLAFAIAPSLSIVAGGLLTSHYGWPSCFYAIIGYSLVLLVCTRFLPETAPYLDQEALHPIKIGQMYVKKLKNRLFTYAALMLGSATACVYVFSTLAPFIAINYIGITPQEYGFFNFIPPIGLVSGCLATHWLATRQERLVTIQLAGKGAFLSFAIMFALIVLKILTPWAIFIPIACAYFGIAIVFNNSIILALEQVEDKSNGSAVMSCISMGTAAAAVFVSQMIISPVFYEMPLFLIFFTSCLLYFSRRFRLSLSS